MDLVVLLCQFAWGCALQRENCINWRPLSWKNVALGQELPWEVLCSFVFVGFLWLLGFFLVVVALFFKCISRIHQFSCNSILWEIRVQGYLKLSGNQHIPCPTLFSQNLAPAARVSSRLCPPCKLTLLHSRKTQRNSLCQPCISSPSSLQQITQKGSGAKEPPGLLAPSRFSSFPAHLPLFYLASPTLLLSLLQPNSRGKSCDYLLPASLQVLPRLFMCQSLPEQECCCRAGIVWDFCWCRGSLGLSDTWWGLEIAHATNPNPLIRVAGKCRGKSNWAGLLGLEVLRAGGGNTKGIAGNVWIPGSH